MASLRILPPAGKYFKKLKEINKTYIWQGAVLGFLVIVAYFFQTFGLADKGTTPGKNAFLTAGYCIIVPFVYWIASNKRPDRYNISAAVLFLIGVTLISCKGGDFTGICLGDGLTLMGGVFFALHIVAVAIFSKDKDILLLTMLQFIFAGIISLIPALIYDSMPANLPSGAITTILYLTVFATCLCYVLQNAGQKYTHPSSASLILCFEAVFGVIFSVIFTEETVSLRMFTGFAVIFISIIISETKLEFLKKSSRVNHKNQKGMPQ